jgi:glycerol kinase
LPSRFDAGTTTGRLRLVNNDGDEISASRKHYAGASARGLAIVPIAPEEQFMYGRRSRFVTYEVVDCDPNVIETVVVEVYVAFESDVAKNRPSIGTPIAT